MRLWKTDCELNFQFVFPFIQSMNNTWVRLGNQQNAYGTWMLIKMDIRTRKWIVASPTVSHSNSSSATIIKPGSVSNTKWLLLFQETRMSKLPVVFYPCLQVITACSVPPQDILCILCHPSSPTIPSPLSRFVYTPYWGWEGAQGCCPPLKVQSSFYVLFARV